MLDDTQHFAQDENTVSKELQCGSKMTLSFSFLLPKPPCPGAVWIGSTSNNSVKKLETFKVTALKFCSQELSRDTRELTELDDRKTKALTFRSLLKSFHLIDQDPKLSFLCGIPKRENF